MTNTPGQWENLAVWVGRTPGERRGSSEGEHGKAIGVLNTCVLFSCSHISKNRQQILTRIMSHSSEINEKSYSILCVENNHDTTSVLFEFLWYKWDIHKRKAKCVEFFEERAMSEPWPGQPRQSPGWIISEKWVFWEVAVLTAWERNTSG